MKQLDKKILIVYTGGTIGMCSTDKGYAPQKERFHKLLAELPDLHDDGMPTWDIVDMEPILDSSNVAVREWNMIASLISENYDKYDGFVILHGTDTMAYTASSLSFMLEGLTKPVVLTGSQIPLAEIRSDGKDNLITALLVAASDRVHEVCLYFGGRLLRGNRSMKVSADGLQAFASPNYPSLAKAGITIDYKEKALWQPSSTEFRLTLLKDIPIGVIKVFPGIQFELFDSIMTEGLKGIVIETFGAGNIPGNGNALLPLIKKAKENGTIIVVCSQCPQGTVSLGTYETSSGLSSAGAVSGYNLTTEAAVAKLYYLFSCGYDHNTIKEMMERDLRGEGGL